MPVWSLDLLIDGAMVRGTGDTLGVENPATEETIVEVGAASTAQVDEAVGAARRAFDDGRWANDPELRRTLLLRLADLMEEHTEELSTAVVLEVGTPVSLCPGMQVGQPIHLFRNFAEMAKIDRTRYLGRTDGPPPNEGEIRMVPSGVVAAIAAYNYPILMAAIKLGAALAAGCTAVLLPSAQTPLSTLLFAKLVKEAGFPPGVVNIVNGGPDVGRALSSHPGVDKVSFTGSAEVGRLVMAQAAPGLKRVMLELGGKSPSLLLPDADLESITEPVHARYLRNAGQGCTSPTRILVHEDRYEEFIAHSRKAFANVKVGDPWDPQTVAGPLISQKHRERVESYVDRAVAGGAEVLVGGGRPDMPKGWYMNSTLVGGITNQAEIAREELFGPVGVVLTYRDVEQAIAIANDSEYGLSATVYGNIDQAREVARRLRTGTVMINGWLVRDDKASGGFKASGMGREMGEDGVREYLETQFIAWPVA